MKLLTKLEIAKNRVQVDGNQVQKQNKIDGDIVVGNLTLDNHFKQINGNMSKIVNDFIKLKGDNAELVKLITAISKSHKAILDELKATKKELRDLKASVKEDIESLKYDEPKEDGVSITIFTDASYDYDTKQGAFGIVTLPDNNKPNEYSGAIELVDDIESISPCYGEGYAVIKALEIASKGGYKDVLLYTDNMAVKNWSETGNQTQNNVAKWFYDEFQRFQSTLNVTIMWMKRCTCEYNTRADELARLSLAQCNFQFYEQKTGETPEPVA